MNVEDAHDIIFNFINKFNGIRANYSDGKIDFIRSENTSYIKHINYININNTKNHVISIVLFSNNVGIYKDHYFGIRDFVKLLIADNVLDDIIIEFEKEILREFR